MWTTQIRDTIIPKHGPLPVHNMATVAVLHSADDLLEDPARLVLRQARAALVLGYSIDVLQEVSTQSQLQHQIDSLQRVEHVIQLDLKGERGGGRGVHQLHSTGAVKPRYDTLRCCGIYCQALAQRTAVLSTPLLYIQVSDNHSHRSV